MLWCSILKKNLNWAPSLSLKLDNVDARVHRNFSYPVGDFVFYLFMHFITIIRSKRKKHFYGMRWEKILINSRFYTEISYTTTTNKQSPRINWKILKLYFSHFLQFIHCNYCLGSFHSTNIAVIVESVYQ